MVKLVNNETLEVIKLLSEKFMIAMTKNVTKLINFPQLQAFKQQNVKTAFESNIPFEKCDSIQFVFPRSTKLRSSINTNCCLNISGKKVASGEKD